MVSKRKYRIRSFSFGKINVGGVEYTDDLIVFPDRVESNWWRNAGHRLQTEDIKEILNSEPDVVVIGTGESALMEIAPSTRKLLRDRGIKLIDEATSKACIDFNEHMARGEKVVGAFHLTC